MDVDTVVIEIATRQCLKTRDLPFLKSMRAGYCCFLVGHVLARVSELFFFPSHLKFLLYVSIAVLTKYER